MSNSERLHSLISDGKLRLSIEDAIALALENNLDISVARYNLGFAQADLLRSRAAAPPAGCRAPSQSSALFSGAIGGGVSAQRRQHDQRQRSHRHGRSDERRGDRLLRPRGRSPVRLGP